MTQPVPDPMLVQSLQRLWVVCAVKWTQESLRTRTGKRGVISKANWLPALSYYKLASMQESQVLGFWGEPNKKQKKKCFQHPWDPVKCLGNKGFQKSRKDTHTTPLQKTRIMQPEVICCLISPSGLMHLKLYFIQQEDSSCWLIEGYIFEEFPSCLCS